MNMKRKIRKGMFETNSSSVHSIVIESLDTLDDFPPVDEDGKVRISPDEFGWEYGGNYSGVQKKLSYLATIICQRLGCWGEEDMLEEIEDDDDFQLVNDVIINYMKCDGWEIVKREDSFHPWGYIDHQSYCGSIRATLNEFSGISLPYFLFSSDVVLVIDNDNH